jgi:hypothetical protein
MSLEKAQAKLEKASKNRAEKTHDYFIALGKANRLEKEYETASVKSPPPAPDETRQLAQDWYLAVTAVEKIRDELMKAARDEEKANQKVNAELLNGS